jgi:hypothetical protein
LNPINIRNIVTMETMTAGLTILLEEDEAFIVSPL